MANPRFDLDGKLVDSAGDLHAAAALILREEAEEPVDVPTIRSFIGNGIPVLVTRIGRQVFGTVEPERRSVAVLNGALRRSTHGDQRLYPRTDEVLRILVAEGRGWPSAPARRPPAPGPSCATSRAGEPLTADFRKISTARWWRRAGCRGNMQWTELRCGRSGSQGRERE